MIRTILIRLSGARPDVLERVPSERHKFEGIGAAVLITGSIGAVAFAFALTTALGVTFLGAVPIGLAWGLVIVSLDRWLVLTIAPVSPRRISLIALRVLLAALIAFILSTPLVLRVFEPEISAQAVVIEQQRADQFEARLASSSEGRQAQSLAADISARERVVASNGDQAIDPNSDPEVRALTAQRDTASRQAQKFYHQWQCELIGGPECTGRAGNGVLAQANRSSYLQAKAKADELDRSIAARTRELASNTKKAKAARVARARADIEEYTKELAEAQKTMERERAAFRRSTSGANAHLIVRLQALNSVGSQSVEITRILLFLFLLSIELLPISMKLNQRPGNYERILALLAREEIHRASIESRRAVSMLEASVERIWSENAGDSPAPSEREMAARRGEREEFEDHALRNMRDGRVAPDSADRDTAPVPPE